jgi:two-component system, response regulator
MGESAMGGSVLLVGASKNADQFASVMRMYGFHNEVAMAHDGVECLDYLLGEGPYEGRDTGVMPRLIVLDLHMPHMDGLETLRRIREDERTRLLPVVMFTATSYPEDVAASYHLGANACIAKPAGSAALVETVRKIAWFWLKVNEPPPKARGWHYRTLSS